MASKDIPDFMRGFDTTDDWGMVPVSSTPKAEPSVDPKLVENSNLEIAKVKSAVGAKYNMNESTDKPKKKANPDICVVYDLEKDAWRSFRWDRLTNVQFNLG